MAARPRADTPQRTDHHEGIVGHLRWLPRLHGRAAAPTRVAAPEDGITQSMVARRAFEIWLVDGAGWPEEHRAQAERELREEHDEQTRAARG